MKRPNITPGEWKRNEHGRILANGDTLGVIGVSLPHYANAEAEANARAIAALPKVLAALEPLAYFFKGDLSAVGGGTHVAPSFPLQAFKDAKAALLEAGYTF